MTQSAPNARRLFAIFAWGVLAYNILVILWGVYVRASYSGDGCGAHWPLCNGEVIPHAAATKTLVEYLHRVMTGLDAPLIFILCVWSFIVFPKEHRTRFYALLAGVFLFFEALLGAGLVLFSYVARNVSIGRAIYLSAHLTNTLLLLSALTLTAWLAQTGGEKLHLNMLSGGLRGALPVTLLISIMGGLAALGDTLFPASSLAAGMQQDFSSSSSIFLRLRLIHPVIAVLGAAYLLWTVALILKKHDNNHLHRAAVRVLGITLFQVAVGGLNITLLSPVWIQIVHLLMADVLWIAVLLMTVESVAARRTSAALSFA